MFDALAITPPSLNTAPPATDRLAGRAPRIGFVARFQALVESMVAASSRQFEGAESTFYRLPPI